MRKLILPFIINRTKYIYILRGGEMKFYKDHYDVVIIGGALAGLSAALQLQQKGISDILILEKHNLPGGLATSYVRNGIEIG